jgi:hypothetical protein
MSEFALTTPSQEPGYQTDGGVQWNYDPELEEPEPVREGAEAQISERDLHGIRR